MHSIEGQFMNAIKKKLPLVYSCSGCSSAAQMANYVALQLDRRGTAEMSCIAGVGGDVPSLVKLAQSGRRIIAIDGCPLACVKQCLARHGVTADYYLPLRDCGVRKQFHADFDQAAAQMIVARIVNGVNPATGLPFAVDAPAPADVASSA